MPIFRKSFRIVNVVLSCAVSVNEWMISITFFFSGVQANSYVQRNIAATTNSILGTNTTINNSVTRSTTSATSTISYTPTVPCWRGTSVRSNVSSTTISNDVSTDYGSTPTILSRRSTATPSATISSDVISTASGSIIHRQISSDVKQNKNSKENNTLKTKTKMNIERDRAREIEGIIE